MNAAELKRIKAMSQAVQKLSMGYKKPLGKSQKDKDSSFPNKPTQVLKRNQALDEEALIQRLLGKITLHMEDIKSEMATHIDTLNRDRKLDFEILKQSQKLDDEETFQRVVGEMKPHVATHIEMLKAELKTPEIKKELDVSEDMVREIIKVMKKMPEADKLEVQDIRNHQAFIYKGTKYGMHEMMHGGSASSPTFVFNEVVAGSGTTFTLAHTPTSGTVQVFGNGQALTPGVANDYTISGAIITTTNSFGAGTILSNYLYS